MSNVLKKSMVYLGLADEEEVYEEAEPQQQTSRKPQATEKTTAPVTPIHRPAVVRQPVATQVSEILTVHPKQYRDAQVIAESFREGVPVIINLSQMSDADARRLIDFASGLSLGLYGRIERVTSKVFLLSPENVSVSGEGAVAQADPDAVPFAHTS
ncbi:cell division protein SepF [Microbacterium aquimaris]|uniref:Cell division protein SepF n=1 Tax=Microbacterium aquimaris TaxID=459816 RepID=A0ABU5N953_9MICO|nr:cell division protein SepF [Microbacterium aquimaris]MAP63335.1 cell division protein SepF [Microbacterium sp.]MDZ8162585.1 cell division protein SepF [Microbacterium aquimaris]MDZ8276247.1 cell division protein SepF [Microbacterium aquimaris]